MHYPKWVPEDLCNLHSEVLERSPNDKLSSTITLERIITESRMEVVWKKIRARSEKLGINNYGIEFYLALCPDGPFGADKKTKAERRKLSNEIEELTDRLTELLAETMPLVLLRDILPDGVRSKSSWFPVSHLISNLREYSKDYLNKPGVLLKPNTENAVRNYFVRKLGAYTQEAYQRKWYDLIATTTEVVFDFDAGKITEDMVKSILRNQ